LANVVNFVIEDL